MSFEGRGHALPVALAPVTLAPSLAQTEPSSRPITLVWGLRHEHDIYYQDELAALAEQFPEFSYTITLSQPSSSWTGAVGRVQTHLDSHIAAVDDLAVYVCGSKAMITSVIEQIRARGMCPIHREQYY